jgi:hypothetical protein
MASFFTNQQHDAFESTQDFKIIGKFAYKLDNSGIALMKSYAYFCISDGQLTKTSARRKQSPELMNLIKERSASFNPVNTVDLWPNLVVTQKGNSIHLRCGELVTFKSFYHILFFFFS